MPFSASAVLSRTSQEKQTPASSTSAMRTTNPGRRAQHSSRNVDEHPFERRAHKDDIVALVIRIIAEQIRKLRTVNLVEAAVKQR